MLNARLVDNPNFSIPFVELSSSCIKKDRRDYHHSIHTIQIRLLFGHVFDQLNMTNEGKQLPVPLLGAMLCYSRISGYIAVPKV